ncbi:DUF3276 family protein [Gracilinema caldarium]|uniref:PUR-alpha/beta/gamma DNA/RNA-binding protein n=1 Tax=Gracilinema caldarium (strain ATCC 51460 / DSM 7334 / H1) TaxID=744872 RepID=F8EXG0_GRAC1|nr:DUF3276 family protein [Gracilinema caldarium]AEJ19187.1 PUR-alpha/beta/gamma DNA/RNA-binding protein [Gracilinema caldarium DSM 7334]
MGMRGELFSTKVNLQNRTYFFNVKENRMGDLYLNIVESKNKETGGFDRQSIVLFAEDLQEFLKGFDGSLKVLEKAYKEKKRAEFEKKDTANKLNAPEQGASKKRYLKKTETSDKKKDQVYSHKEIKTVKGNKKPVIRTIKKDSVQDR